MISSAISADLGRQEALRGSQEALATVTGIVDGTGSIGAAAGQVNRNTLYTFRKLSVKCPTDISLVSYSLTVIVGHFHILISAYPVYLYLYRLQVPGVPD